AEPNAEGRPQAEAPDGVRESRRGALRPGLRPEGDVSASPRERSQGPAGRPGRRRRRGHPLPLGTRVVLATLGVLFLVLGVAGLFLPFLQGILLLMLAAAVLSLASDTVYGWLKGLLSDRTPSFWKRVERFRTRVRWRFRR
ncbi:MAG: hypothetical protein ACOC7L_02880, partial [Acidobacteriota bacterium]